MQNLKTLLLSASYETLSLINERKALKLLLKDKAELISSWEEDITWGSGKMKYPAILKLKNHIKITYFNTNFSRKSVVKRDQSYCQYCNKKLSPSQITIDHVIPKSQKGSTSFTNCVVCCNACNSKKADRTPEQAGMKLLKKPVHPSFTSNYISEYQDQWHNDWNSYILK